MSREFGERLFLAATTFNLSSAATSAVSSSSISSTAASSNRDADGGARAKGLTGVEEKRLLRRFLEPGPGGHPFLNGILTGGVRDREFLPPLRVRPRAARASLKKGREYLEQTLALDKWTSAFKRDL